MRINNRTTRIYISPWVIIIIDYNPVIDYYNQVNDYYNLVMDCCNSLIDYGTEKKLEGLDYH